MARAKRLARWVALGMAMILLAYVGLAWWSSRGPAFERGGGFGSGRGGAGLPAAGVYVYAAAGSERVDLGGFSACEWDVDEVRLTVSHQARGAVFDQRVGERLERTIYRATAGGDELSYAASAVTCLGIRTTSEDVYEPPALRFGTAMAPGDTWRTVAATAQRTERATVTVLGRERVTVPAGSFDVVVVRVAASFEGRITGSAASTYWFEQTRRLWVKHEATTTARRSGSTFTSSYTAELVSEPA